MSLQQLPTTWLLQLNKLEEDKKNLTNRMRNYMPAFSPTIIFIQIFPQNQTQVKN